MRRLAAAGAVLLLGLVSGAHAQSYVYEAVSEAGMRQTGQVEAAGIVWTCNTKSCVSEGPWPEPGMEACRALARAVGPLASYGHQKAQFDAAQLAECNGKAGGKPATAADTSLTLVAPPVAVAPPVLTAPSISAGQRLPRPFETRQDCAECPVMIWVPGGTFGMGAPTGRGAEDVVVDPQSFWANEPRVEDLPNGDVRVRLAWGYSAALPRRAVTVQGYWLGKFEVTQAQWNACVRAGACRPPHDGAHFTSGPNHPITHVNFYDLQAYVRWLSARTGRRYRLPSEAEWEYAARAGVDQPRWWGPLDEACRYENIADRGDYISQRGIGCRDGYLLQAPVGAFPPNPWGFHDMLGNVGEMVQDVFISGYAGVPNDGAAFDPPGGGMRVIRGFAIQDASYANVWLRHFTEQGHEQVTGGVATPGAEDCGPERACGYDFGFRVAAD